MFGGTSGSGGTPLATSEASPTFTNYPVAPAFDWQPVIVLVAVAGVALVALVFIGKLFSSK